MASSQPHPPAPSAPGSSSGAHSGPPSGGAAGPRPRVLVIDDSQTILKVVGIILQLNGFEVALARDGVEGFQQLEEAGPFDLVLLDFVMPRMNGYQFCRKLRADPKHKDVPVVLMSARTSTIGDRFVEQTGAVDALSKPFDARALVAVVQVVLSRQASHHERHSMVNPELMVDEEELDRLSVEEDAPPASRHLRSLTRVGSTIAGAVAPKLSALSPAELGQPHLVERAIAEAIDESVIAAIGSAMEDMQVETHPGETLRGQLGKMPLAEVLQLFQLRRQTGLMRVSHGRKQMTLSFAEGYLQLAQSENTGDEYRLGRYFVEAGWLTREQLDSELEAYQGQGRLIGEWLAEKELINEEQLRHALAKQSSELVYEVLRWPEGRFILTDDPLTAEAEKAQLYLGVSELVLEGFRRVDEWRHMADTINFDAVLVVDQVALGTLDDSKIGQNERAVLEAIDGKRTAREAMEEAEVASFDAIQAVYGFLQSRIVREVNRERQGSASSMPPYEQLEGKPPDEGQAEAGNVNQAEDQAEDQAKDQAKERPPRSEASRPHAEGGEAQVKDGEEAKDAAEQAEGEESASSDAAHAEP